MGCEGSLHCFACNWFPWGPAQSIISDKMDSNGEVTNYKAIMSGLVNKISQSVIRVLYLREHRVQKCCYKLMCNLVILLGKAIRPLAVL